MVGVFERKDNVDCALAERTGGLFVGLVDLVEAVEVHSVEAGLEDDAALFDPHEVKEQVGVAHLRQVAHLFPSVALAAD